MALLPVETGYGTNRTGGYGPAMASPRTWTSTPDVTSRTVRGRYVRGTCMVCRVYGVAHVPASRYRKMNRAIKYHTISSIAARETKEIWILS